jgi:hypothetical protein
MPAAGDGRQVFISALSAVLRAFAPRQRSGIPRGYGSLLSCLVWGRCWAGWSPGSPCVRHGCLPQSGNGKATLHASAGPSADDAAIWAYVFHNWELLGMWAWTPAFLAAGLTLAGSAPMGWPARERTWRFFTVWASRLVFDGCLLGPLRPRHRHAGAGGNQHGAVPLLSGGRRAGAAWHAF